MLREVMNSGNSQEFPQDSASKSHTHRGKELRSSRNCCGMAQRDLPRLLTDFPFLAVPQPPTITKQSIKDYIVDPRDNIFIECEAKGNPVPT